MISAPPTGSSISVKTEGGESIVEIPYQASASRYFGGLFLLFWLGGWAFGFANVGSQILSGKANAFMIFWLGGWTIGGGFAAYAVYRIFRPSVPETLRLNSSGIAYDSGIAPAQMNTGSTNRTQAWKSMFPRRTRLELDRRTLRTLQLRPTDSSNRLTVDSGASRIDIAQAASEMEREWLYRLIASKYSLPTTSKDPLSTAE